MCPAQYPVTGDDELKKAKEQLIREIKELKAETEKLKEQMLEQVHAEAVSACDFQKRFKEAIDNNPLVPVQGFDRHGVVQHWNFASEQLSGYTQNEAIGNRMQDMLFSREFAGQFEEIAREVWWSGKPSLRMEWEITTKHGQHKNLIFTIFPVFEKGSVAELFSMAVDVTDYRRSEEALIRTRDEMERRVEERTAELKEVNKNISVEIEQRKQIERELRASRNMLKLIIDTNPHGIFWKDTNSVYLGCNVAFARDVGSDNTEDVVGKTDYDLSYRIEEAEVFRAYDRQVMNEDRSHFHIIERLTDASGRLRWLDTDKVPLHDEEGKVIGVLGTYNDITDRKKLEESLKLNEFANEKAADQIFRITEDGKILYVNDAVSRSLGYTKEELLQMNVKDFDQNYNTEKIKGFWQRLKDEKSFIIETRHRAKDGRVFPVEMSVNYLTYERNEYCYAFVRDITDRKKLEESLKLNEFSNEKAADQIYRIGSDGKILYVNEAACNYLGHTKEELLQKYVYDYDLIYDPQKFHSFWQRLKAEKSLIFEFEQRIVDGDVKPIEISASYLDYQGKEYCIAFARDITERRRAEKLLREAKAEAEMYVDLMGHDINNMNQIAMGFLEMAQEKLNTEGMLTMDDTLLISRPLETLEDSSRLIGNVKKIQKEKAGFYRPGVMNVEEVVREAVDQYSHVSGRDVTFTLTVRNSCKTRANELLIEVFSNLVGNAIKHTSGPLLINITAEVVSEGGKRYCQVAVEDNGPGISDILKKILFDRLSLSSAKASGKGFGLCLIKMLVDDFGGIFRVEDRVSGDYSKGCRFVVMLPVAEH